MRQFIHFKDVNPAVRESWSGKTLLSFDVDWVSDEVFNWFVDFLEETKLVCTVFITHDTPVLQRLHQMPFVEIGIHPFFKTDFSDYKEVKRVVNELMKLVPDSKVLRSHRLTTSASWHPVFAECGITHISNYVMFGCDQLKPFPHINGLIETPIFFADDGLLRVQEDNNLLYTGILDKIEQASPDIRVFDFHPIHCFLNSESLRRYEVSRDFSHDFSKLRENVNRGDGILNLLKKIIHG